MRSLPGLARYLSGEWASRRRRAVGVAASGPLGGVEQRGAVAHRPGEGVLDGPAGADVAVLRA